MENTFEIGDIVTTKEFGLSLQVNQIHMENMISCIYIKDDILYSIIIHSSLLRHIEKN